MGDRTVGEGCQAVVEKEGQRMVCLRDEQKIQTPQRRVAGRLVSPWATHSLSPLCHHPDLSQQTRKLPEENTGQYFSDCGIGKDFLNRTQHEPTIKAKTG